MPSRGSIATGSIRQRLLIVFAVSHESARPLTMFLRPRSAPFDRIGWIVEARRRGMAAHHEAIDQGFVFGGKAIVERADIFVPLLFGARTRKHGGHE